MEATKHSYLDISDTGARATSVRQAYLMGKTLADVEELASKSPVTDLFLFCPIEGVPIIIQDGTRKDGEHRFNMEQQLREGKWVQRLFTSQEIGKNTRKQRLKP